MGRLHSCKIIADNLVYFTKYCTPQGPHPCGEGKCGEGNKSTESHSSSVQLHCSRWVSLDGQQNVLLSSTAFRIFANL